MQLATGGDMLNFGYWQDKVLDPVSAQENLCRLVGEVAELSRAEALLDIGSGLGAPAKYWKAKHPSVEICCVNINFSQLATLAQRVSSPVASARQTASATVSEETTGISPLNATSTHLPVARSSFDRIVALESAQHFRPVESFVSESARALKPGGLLVMAIPVISSKIAASFLNLGILAMTWSSEHYTSKQVERAILATDMSVVDLSRIGHRVYEPLADYYVQYRQELREKILTMYPPFVEKILYRSMIKMRKLSAQGVIDYIIVKAEKRQSTLGT